MCRFIYLIVENFHFYQHRINKVDELIKKFFVIMRADSPRKLVVGHVISTATEPSSNWREIHYNSSDAGVQLEYALRVLCNVSYHSVGCDVFCRPRDDVHGHYTCSSNGTIVCLPGWLGKFCETGSFNWL